jgi:hypothetical protein
MRASMQCACERCGAQFSARPDKVAKGMGHYCSKRCAVSAIRSASTRPVIDRLSDLSIPEPNSGCRLFLGSLNDAGYGKFGMGHGGWDRAHRVAYSAFIGPIPDGLTIDHLCRNRACIEPTHLEAVSKRTNTLRGISPAAIHARKTACHNGHEFTEENTYIEIGNSARHCRQCRRDRGKARQADKEPPTPAATEMVKAGAAMLPGFDEAAQRPAERRQSWTG